MSTLDEQEKRIAAIIGTDEEDTNFEEDMERFFQYLGQHLQLPCDVTGIEDFNWEEPYVLGGWDQDEYKKLKKNYPSYEDTFQLLTIHNDIYSEWKICMDDLTAGVRGKSDNKEFFLGLSELEAVKKGTPNGRLLDDYAVWFVNNR